jgi:hypothetical protein
MNADHGKTAATTEVVSSHPAETRHCNSKRRRNTFCAWKNRWRTEKKNCKSMKRDENDQSYKKESTPVVGKRPNGKSQLKPVHFDFVYLAGFTVVISAIRVIGGQLYLAGLSSEAPVRLQRGSQ